MGRRKFILILSSIFLIAGIYALWRPVIVHAQASAEPVVLGVLFDFLRERWPRDRDALVQEADRQSAKLLVKSSESNDELQIAQAKELISQGVKVLLVVPHNLKKAGEIVKLAHDKGVKVIAYDRLIRDCDLDFYVSFDNQKVGELEAEYGLAKAGSGNYVLLGGSPSDNNAIMIHAGWMKVLEPAVKEGKIKIAVDQYTAEWRPVIAGLNMANAVKRLNGNISVVLAGNDNLADAAIMVLEGKGLSGKVAVIGQDAELSALRRIVAGQQAMTIYKPIPKLAQAAMELAVKITRGEKVNQLFTRTINNGFKDVPALLLPPVVVDKDNLDKTVLQDGFYTKAQVYGQK